MATELERVEETFRAELSAAAGRAAAVDEVRVRYLGKKGLLTSLLRALGSMPPEERKASGLAVNALKERIESELAAAAARAAAGERLLALESDRVDPTLPPRVRPRGALHPVTAARRELEAIFRSMGFAVESGPEVEDDFHNFEALNLPPGHPARDATDTFYLEGGLLLRTHTSPVQIRTMLASSPPIRMICPGRVYRRDLDATHLPMFHQVEGLVVDAGISLADLKGTLSAVWSRFFGEEVRVRLRPGYFPFVEPGCEYDVSCRVCRGAGCRACKESGWLELGGAGMVHPAVFEAVGIDPERYTGFAFGLGIDRIAMQQWQIDDLRLLIDNDVRFLSQFR
jgi:phenylalanyl-tRNA synthetase alpha chain